MAVDFEIIDNNELQFGVGDPDELEFGTRDIIEIRQSGDYEDLTNKPSINGVTLIGNKTTSDLGIDVGVTSWNGQTGDVVYTPPEVPVQSVNGKTGAVVLNASDVGALPSSTAIPTKTSDLANDSGFITGINSSDVTSALGYTPYNSTNPNGYVNATQAANAAPVQSVNGKTGVVSLSASDVSALPSDTPIHNVPSGGTSGQVLTKSSNSDYAVEWSTPTGAVSSVNGQTGAVVLDAADVGALPDDTVIPSKVSQLQNDTGFITGITSGDVTSALGYTPYNSANPSGYVNSAQAASAAPVQSVNGQTGNVSLSIPTVPTNVSAFTNDANYITSAGAPVQSVNGETGTVVLDATDVGALPDTTKYAGSATVGGVADKAASIPYGKLNSTSTATVMTATVPGITELKSGVCVWLTNGVVTGGSNFTLNINGLGAKGVYSSQAAATRISSVFNINYTGLFIYNEDRVSGGCWDYVYGYDTNTNTIGYQVRTNSMSLPMTSIVYRYRLLFQSADNAHFVPATNSTSTNATAARTVCQDPINPFGSIVYYGTTASVAAGSRPSAGNLWQQYAFTLGYSFQKSPNYELTAWKPIYLKCAPQTNGSAIIDDTTPFVQDLPTTEDGKIYIWLGVAHSTTAMELTIYHPVYYYKDGAIREWTNAGSSVPQVTSVDNGKVLMVVNGAWAVASLPIWDGGVI